MSWMVEEINVRGGSISFREYMQLALYHPDHGYYSSSETPRYGRSGDYLTAPSASSWYARVIARLLRSLADAIGPMVLVDVGAGDGSFIAGVVESLGADPDSVLRSVLTIERSPIMVRVQGERLQDLGVRWRQADDVSVISSAGSPVTVHASELYDALPVHRVEMGPDGICEMWVAVEHGLLEWRRRPARPELTRYLADHGVVLEQQQIADVSLEWNALHRRLLGCIPRNGLALVLDYGYPAMRLFNPRARAGGSLSCFRGHRLSRNPLEDPGHLDITAHVNLDDLRSAAAGAGWTDIGWWPMAEFLVKAGIEDVMGDLGVGEDAELSADVVTERQEIKRLLDPDGMGVDLKMLIQGRGVMVDAARGIFGAP